MQDVNVVVVFQSGSEWTERVALTAAVGAVQGRAYIRLRRLQDRSEDNMDYVAPRDADAEWADALLIGIAPDAESFPAEFEGYLAKFRGKIGAAFTEGSGAASLRAAIARAGMIDIAITPGPDAMETARLQGRRVAESARSRRAGV